MTLPGDFFFLINVLGVSYIILVSVDVHSLIMCRTSGRGLFPVHVSIIIKADFPVLATSWHAISNLSPLSMGS